MSGQHTPWPKCRRTHSVHETREEAAQAALNLGRLMNGVPCGYVFAVQEKMGKFAFISLRSGDYARARGEA